MADVIGDCRATFAHHSLGEESARFHEGDVVHESEGLQGRVRAALAHSADFPIARVERHHGRRRNGAAPVSVEAAAVEILAGVALVFVVGNRTPDFWWHVGLCWLAVELLHQQSAGCERLIANGEGRQTQTGSAGQKSIFRISIAECRCSVR